MNTSSNSAKLRWQRENPKKHRDSNKKYRLSHKKQLQLKDNNYRKTHLKEINEYSKKWSKANPDKVCQYNKNWQDKNRSRHLKNRRKWRAANRDKCSLYWNNWKIKNEQKIKSYFKKWKKENPLQWRARERIRGALKRYGDNPKKQNHTIDLLGCSFVDYKIYIMSLLKGGMTWDLLKSGAIHIDHIRPISSFDLTNELELKAAFHFSNTQPLWARDNLIKHAHWEGERKAS